MTELRIDMLISRIVDKVETPEEWGEFRAIAATEPSAWELLAEATRDNDRLVTLAREATDFAERVELPDSSGPPPLYRFRRRMFEGAGWVAAAALIIAWITTGRAGVTSVPSDVQTAGAALPPAPALSADDAFSRYLDQGQADGIVVGEVNPKILLETSALPAGGFEVVFVRQVIERRQVPTMVRFSSTDESGKAHARVVRPTVRDSM